MNATIARPARRLAVTLAAAGIAALGSVAIAPSASAAPAVDGPAYIVEHDGNGNGPDAFLVSDHGRKPVFFCEDGQPKGHAKNCVPGIEDGGTRF
jgi:hypothetical protein